MTETALQKLLIKRFLLAVSTYSLVVVLAWVAFLCGHFLAPPGLLVAGSGLMLLTQVLLGLVFLSGINLRFKDPSLTELQIVLALIGLTWLLAHLGQARGTFMVVYPLILMFGLFHLRGCAFVRCAALVFGCFLVLNGWEGFTGRMANPSLALLQGSALLVVLVWLCLYARYVQASRQRIRKHRFALQAHQDTLRGMMRQLEELVATDELTGLFNRRHFLRLAEQELGRMEAGGQHGLALIDLDHFKRINDVYGHAVGDQVLQAFAHIARACLRETDIVARYGGEEFVLLLPHCSAQQLSVCCERLRRAFAEAELAAVVLPGSHLSLSAGMTLLNKGDDLDAALHRADQALYRAKHGGRNRCLPAWEYADA